MSALKSEKELDSAWVVRLPSTIPATEEICAGIHQKLFYQHGRILSRWNLRREAAWLYLNHCLPLIAEFKLIKRITDSRRTCVENVFICMKSLEVCSISSHVLPIYLQVINYVLYAWQYHNIMNMFYDSAAPQPLTQKYGQNILICFLITLICQ